MTALANRYDYRFPVRRHQRQPERRPGRRQPAAHRSRTNKGLVSDVSLKRKIRNYTELTKSDQPGYRIYVQEGSILNDRHREAYRAVRPATRK